MGNIIWLIWVESGDNSTLDEFFGNICEYLEKYFSCLKFLNQNLGFIHTDLKCKNVFVRTGAGSRIRWK